MTQLINYYSYYTCDNLEINSQEFKSDGTITPVATFFFEP